MQPEVSRPALLPILTTASCSSVSTRSSRASSISSSSTHTSSSDDIVRRTETNNTQFVSLPFLPQPISTPVSPRESDNITELETLSTTYYSHNSRSETSSQVFTQNYAQAVNSLSTPLSNAIAQALQSKRPPKERSKEKSSSFRGVSKCSKDGRWQARIRVGKSVKYLGRFKSEVDAAKAYDLGALKYHGLKAQMNFANISSLQQFNENINQFTQSLQLLHGSSRYEKRKELEKLQHSGLFPNLKIELEKETISEEENKTESECNLNSLAQLAEVSALTEKQQERVKDFMLEKDRNNNSNNINSNNNITHSKSSSSVIVPANAYNSEISSHSSKRKHEATFSPVSPTLNTDTSKNLNSIPQSFTQNEVKNSFSERKHKKRNKNKLLSNSHQNLLNLSNLNNVQTPNSTSSSQTLPLFRKQLTFAQLQQIQRFQQIQQQQLIQRQLLLQQQRQQQQQQQQVLQQRKLFEEQQKKALEEKKEAETKPATFSTFNNNNNINNTNSFNTSLLNSNLNIGLKNENRNKGPESETHLATINALLQLTQAQQQAINILKLSNALSPNYSMINNAIQLQMQKTQIQNALDALNNINTLTNNTTNLSTLANLQTTPNAIELANLVALLNSTKQNTQNNILNQNLLSINNNINNNDSSKLENVKDNNINIMPNLNSSRSNDLNLNYLNTVNNFSNQNLNGQSKNMVCNNNNTVTRNLVPNFSYVNQIKGTNKRTNMNNFKANAIADEIILNRSKEAVKSEKSVRSDNQNESEVEIDIEMKTAIEINSDVNSVQVISIHSKDSVKSLNEEDEEESDVEERK